MIFKRGAVRRAIVVSLAVGAAMAAAAVPAHAAAAPFVEGSGSVWAANAVQQWIADLSAQGTQLVYTASGSAQGRKDFAFRTNDFAVSDIPFQGTDPVTGLVDTSGGRPYAYVPLVAGAVAFPYQLRVNGQLVRDLQFSGLTLAKIFTGAITNWDDPAIAADNNGRVLPSLPIIPVVHAEGAGTSAQLSAYLASQFPALWTAYNSGNPAPSEYYPMPTNGVAQNGSDAVMNFVASAAANGAIGVDEYSYALNANSLVARVGNAGGGFALPTADAVTAALTHASTQGDPNSPDYLTGNLGGVYATTDPLAYPLSSYAYLMLPTGTNAQDPRMITSKRQVLANGVAWMLCQGQLETGPIGYAPLPPALVQAGFGQLAKLHSVDPAVSVYPDCASVPWPAQPPVMPAPLDVPVQATDNTAPYAGSLSLSVSAGTSVAFSQVDPNTPGGHPSQGTDPTGHRHAWVFTGDLAAGVTVSDTRPGQPGWSISGQASDFHNGATVVGAENVGWAPRLVSTGSDAEGTVTAGPVVAPHLQDPTSPGLSVGSTLGTAGSGSGLGTQNVGATLQWWIPDTSPTGTYTATLTLTLISA
jgi:ABC-type phosphate transport system substrate-binding protein